MSQLGRRIYYEKTMVNTRRLILAPGTQQAILADLLSLARRGVDVQEFDPNAVYGGCKQPLSEQRGYYGQVVPSRLDLLGDRLRSLLECHAEREALSWFDDVRRLARDSSRETPPEVQVIHVLPDVFQRLEPEHLRAPNGMRVPPEVREPQAVAEYSALLLLPKLFLAAMAGICQMNLWIDPDLDLGSAVHTIRADSDKLSHGSGYGAAVLPCHTDGYWNEESTIPVWNAMLCITNPYLEPTRFIRVADVFRVLRTQHRDYTRWLQTFRDLIIPGQDPSSFVQWVVSESLMPQFSFVMGQIGGGAARAVRNVPLLQKHRNLPGYLFRYKSTFVAETENAKPVVEFVNRMVKYLADDCVPNLHGDVALNVGEVLFSLNGSCLRVSVAEPRAGIDCDYPVWGSATIHGRQALRIVDGEVDRTFIRGNLVASRSSSSYAQESAAADFALPSNGPVRRLLEQGYRANHLSR